MPTAHTIRILIADDTRLIRELLAAQLRLVEGFLVVGQACDGREAVDKALALRPDVIVMDLDMPHWNGIQAVERIKASFPHVSVVLLTAHSGLAPIGRFSGVSECIDKNCAPEELIQAIRRAGKGNGLKGVVDAVDVNYDVAIAVLSSRAALTDRERAVFEKAVNTDLTIEQIASILSLESTTTVTISSVKHALDRAITKLRIEPRTRATLVKHVLEFAAQSSRNME